MADNTPKKVNKDVHGGKAKATEKGAHGGGNKYNQMAVGKGFMVHDSKPGSVINKGNQEKS
jgi:hypothetical protein